MTRIPDLVVLGSLAIPLVTARANAAEPLSAESLFAGLDYSVRETGHREPTEWEKDELGVRTVKFWSLKGVEPLSRDPTKWTSKVWYRFEVTRESFDTESAAKARLPRLLEKPPGIRIDERKSFPLRRGFQSGTRVYTVATDVAMFEPEMERLAARLQGRPPP